MRSLLLLRRSRRRWRRQRERCLRVRCLQSRVAEKVTAESAGDGFALGVTLRVETIVLTVTEALLQLLEAKLASPEYVQVMLSVPGGNAEVVYVAVLLVTATVESAVPLL